MKTNRFFFPLLCAAVSLLAQSAVGCYCAGEEDPKTALEASDAVFSGRAVAERILTPNHPDHEQRVREITFDVASLWKGRLGRRVRIRTAIDGAMCGYAFQKAVTYIVYARMERGQLRTDMCSRTRRLDQAQADLHVLGPIRKPSP